MSKGDKMRTISKRAGRVCYSSILALSICCIFSGAHAGAFSVLHVFTGADGALPRGKLVADQSGNLYGTTQLGGTYDSGTVFRLANNGTFTTLYSFGSQGGDGVVPQGSLVMDQSGNLFGTTAGGGANSCDDSAGCGTIFEVTPGGVETVLYSFQGDSDGELPLGGVILDQSGNLYGTTFEGGGGGCFYTDPGCGTVFKYSTSLSMESVLYSFLSGGDGEFPFAALAMDQTGNLYGTTLEGGSSGVGTVFELSSGNAETVLHSFQGGSDGALPYTEVTLDKGNLYGTTYEGGGSACTGSGCGTIYELTPGESVLHAYQGIAIDGALPLAGVTIDAKRNLYSSTCGTEDGCQSFIYPGRQCSKGCNYGDVNMIPGCCESGTAPVATKGIKVIHRFDGGKLGSSPAATMLLYSGFLYGTTEFGGSTQMCQNFFSELGCGTIYKLRP